MYSAMFLVYNILLVQGTCRRLFYRIIFLTDVLVDNYDTFVRRLLANLIDLLPIKSVTRDLTAKRQNNY